MLCKTCQNIFKGPLGHGREIPSFGGQTSYSRDHHNDFADLYHAFKQGCFICNKLWDKFLLSWIPSTTLPTLHLKKCELWFPKRLGESPTLMVEYKLSESRYGEIGEMLELAPTRGIGIAIIHQALCSREANSRAEIRFYLHSGPHADRTDSAATLDLASTWLEKCIASHPECNRDIMTARMPTRLLKLGYPTPEQLQLCINKHARTNSRYMTLSHCWGSAQFLKLTTGSVEQLSMGIYLSSLPQTFQDAAKIAKRLGVQYLWIDSLCIFQDSVEDWQRESSMMGDVYKGALCNIAATASADSSGGCFRKREPRLLEPCTITTGYTNHSNNEYHIRENDYLRNILHCRQPLFHRGWVVQERVLPPRVLHFGETQVFWECRTEDACETYPSGLLPTTYNTSDCLKRQNWLTSTTNAHTQPGTQNFQILCEDVYSFWWKIIVAYSQCNLTREEDKLVAISGLAKEVYTAFEGHNEYLAGLWRRNILYQLLWTCGSFSTLGVRPEHYRAPTWSWASLDGNIHKPTSRDPRPNLYVTLIDVQVDCSTENAFGQVKTGYIRLRGPLLTVTFEEKEADDPLEGQETYYDAFLNGQQTGENAQPRIDVDGVIAHPLHFMPFYADSNPEGPYVIRGLLLQSTGIAKGQFRRCGILNIFDKAMTLTGWPSWTSIQNQDWLEYEEANGSEYTISIR